MLENPNVYKLLKSAEQLLKSHNLPEAKSDAEVLLSHVLGVKRSTLPLIREKLPDKEQISIFNEYINRRANREPAAYITGSCGFMEFEFKVNPSVLIPRPETELLVEEVLKKSHEKSMKTVLDLCTGSGCIAVSLSKNGKFDEITATDISADALKTARENAQQLGAANINFVQSDIFNNIAGMKFDIIVSNPPYVSEDEYKNLEPELMFEPKTALTASNNGLFFYQKIAEEGSIYLNPGGMIFLELNSNCRQQVNEIFAKEGFVDIKVLKDYSNQPRILTACLKENKNG